MRFWRISNFADVNGEGGRLFSARWHTRGVAIVYLADHPASALLEIIANTSLEYFPESVQFLEIEGPDADIQSVELPSFWKEDQFITRGIGNLWLKTQSSCMLKVPSSLSPYSWNYLLNPQHAQAHEFQIRSTFLYKLDERLK